MNRDVITVDSALYRTRCSLCKQKYRLKDQILTHQTDDVLGGWVAWHVDCVQDLITPRRLEATPEEVAAFIAKERARIEARRVA